MEKGVAELLALREEKQRLQETRQKLHEAADSLRRESEEHRKQAFLYAARIRDILHLGSEAEMIFNEMLDDRNAYFRSVRDRYYEIREEPLEARKDLAFIDMAIANFEKCLAVMQDLRETVSNETSTHEQ